MTIYINGGTASVDVTFASAIDIDNTDSPYQIPAGAESIDVDCSGGAITIYTDNTSGKGNIIIISDVGGDATTNNITISSAGGTIDGAANLVLNTNWASVTIKYLGSNNWKII